MISVGWARRAHQAVTGQSLSPRGIRWAQVPTLPCCNGFDLIVVQSGVCDRRGIERHGAVHRRAHSRRENRVGLIVVGWARRAHPAVTGQSLSPRGIRWAQVPTLPCCSGFDLIAVQSGVCVRRGIDWHSAVHWRAHPRLKNRVGMIFVGWARRAHQAMTKQSPSPRRVGTKHAPTASPNSLPMTCRHRAIRPGTSGRNCA